MRRSFSYGRAGKIAYFLVKIHFLAFLLEIHVPFGVPLEFKLVEHPFTVHGRSSYAALKQHKQRGIVINFCGTLNCKSPRRTTVRLGAQIEAPPFSTGGFDVCSAT